MKKIAFTFLLILALAGTAFGETLTIQPNSTHNSLDASAKTTNRSHEQFGQGVYCQLVLANNSSYCYRVILNFGFTSLPANALISSATLSLYYFAIGDGDPAGRTYLATRVTTTNWTQTGSNWNTRDGTNNWTTEGGDYTLTNAASATMPASFSWVNWNVTTLVQYFQANTSRIAYFEIKDSSDFDSSGTGAFFYSEDSGGGNMPKLVITYTVPPQPPSSFFFGH